MVPIVPKPQARPRFSTRTRRAVDPTAAYKRTFLQEFVHAAGPEQMAHLPMDGAVTMRMEFVFARPMSHYRKRKRNHDDNERTLTARAAQQPEFLKKPDIDNLVKRLVHFTLHLTLYTILTHNVQLTPPHSTMDALNGVAYADDAQVTNIVASKRWARENDPSCVLIDIVQLRCTAQVVGDSHSTTE